MSYWRKTLKPLLADEIGTIYQHAPTRVALAFPNRYSVGMASLGFQVIYRMFNQEENFACERAFLPDDVDAFKQSREFLPMMESGDSVGNADLIAFSVSFELDITNIIRFLELSGLKAWRTERDDADPVVIVGGPLTSSNPYPLAPFADVICIGDGEEIVPIIAEAWREANSREEFYELLEGRPGIYLPDRMSHEPLWATAPKEKLPAFSQIVTPHSELSNMFLVEAQRGCPRPCTFCLARTMYGPNRNNEADDLLACIPDWVKKVGLVGAALSDFKHTKYVGRTLTQRGVKLGVSSIRADTVDTELAQILRDGGLRSFTVASDAASQRLRDWMKKGISEADLLKTAHITKDLGFSGLKVYMMIGLPPENDDDISELITFSKELSKITKVAMGISPFVPKRHTPHHADPFAGVDVIEKRFKRIQKELRRDLELRNVSAKWAWVESVIARGGPEIGKAAYLVKDNESFSAWKSALEQIGWRDEYAENRVTLEMTPGQVMKPMPRGAVLAGVGGLMVDSLEIKIGYESSEYVALTVTDWSVNTDFGGWWLECEAGVSLGTFTANVDGEALTSDELKLFQASLERLHTTLHAGAALHSIDDWIELELTGNGLGGISMHGHICDMRRNQLTFHFDLDQTFLPKIIAQIKSVFNRIENKKTA